MTVQTESGAGSAPAQVSASATRPMVVLVGDKLAPEGVAVLEQAGIEARVAPGLTPEELLAAVSDVDGILVRSACKVTADVLAAAPRLRAVGRAGIGVDNIDVADASRHGVLVMNTPRANAITTGELAIAHIFALARHIPDAVQSMRDGRWDKSKLTGSEIHGKTLLVVGLGKIGQVVAERGRGLGMRVVAFDPFLTGPSPLPGVELVGWDEGLAAADFVSIHVPKNKDTLGLFDDEAFSAMKPGARLVNCARGGIVVEADLVAALNDGRLAGAALDVFETEPLPEDSPLRSVPNLLLSPHLGASSDEAQLRVSVEIAEQMRDYLLHGEARCALNAPTIAAEHLVKLRPWLALARRCGLILAQTADDPLVRAEITYVGELNDQDTDPLRIGVMAGLLAPALDGPVNVVNAPLLAKERGLAVLEEHDPTGVEFTSLLRVVATTAAGVKHRVAGTVFRGQPRLVRFGGFFVDFVPQGEMLMTRHSNAPGVLGLVATYLGQRGVNIGGLHMGNAADEQQLALALYQLDRPLTSDEEQQLANVPGVDTLRSISF